MSEEARENNLFHHLTRKMQFFTTLTVISVLLALTEPGNSIRNDSGCVLADIKSRLEIASQILETVRQNLPSDMNDLCKNIYKCPECKETCECPECKVTCECPECKETCECPECKEKICDAKPVDCSDIFLDGERRDGIYDIWPHSKLLLGPIKVYCDMESNGGGWTVVQRRGNYGSPEDYFYQDWNAYKKGFGDMLKDFWIGNDNLFALTSQRPYQLRVNLSDWEGKSVYATYHTFAVADELHNYTLSVKGYNGTAGDSLTRRHDGRNFFTKDRDNKHRCAVDRKGGWWYADCTDSNLNGLYKGKHSSTEYEIVFWDTFHGIRYSLKDTVMKIRPGNFLEKTSG